MRMSPTTLDSKHGPVLQLICPTKCSHQATGQGEHTPRRPVHTSRNVVALAVADGRANCPEGLSIL